MCAGSTLGSGEGARVPGHPTGVEGAAGAQCCTQGPAGLSPPAARPPQPAPSRRRLVAGCDKGSAAGGEAVAEEAAALDGSRGRLLSGSPSKNRTPAAVRLVSGIRWPLAGLQAAAARSRVGTETKVQDCTGLRSPCLPGSSACADVTSQLLPRDGAQVPSALTS